MTAQWADPATGHVGDPCQDPVVTEYAQQAEAAHRSRRSTFIVSLKHHNEARTASVIDIVSEQGWTLAHIAAVSGVDGGPDTLHMVFLASSGERVWRT